MENILCYDLRNLVQPAMYYPLGKASNYKNYFDIDPTGIYLAMGTPDGFINIYDITHGTTVQQYKGNNGM